MSYERILLGAIAVVFCAGAGVCFGATITVGNHGPVNYKTIRAAINAATDGDTVLVADGTYTGDGNRDIDFLGKAITVKSENGPDNCIIDCESSGRGFIFQSGEDANSVLDGFSIINGRTPEDGGGICCYYSSPTIKNCVLSNNMANGGWGEEAYGGGIYFLGSDTKIDNCTFSNNTAYGYEVDPEDFFTIYFGKGGGIYCEESAVVVTNCAFLENVANGQTTDDGGGGMYCENSELTMKSCRLVGNKANNRDGGGICCYASNTTITDCEFDNNSADDYDYGGGLYGCNGMISNCIISGNTARAGGGLAYCGGEISNCIITGNDRGGLFRCNGMITNCTIIDNSSYYGGGLCQYDGTIINCIIAGNTSYDDGGGLYDCRGTISNCIISGNTADDYGGGLSGCSGSINNCIISENMAGDYGGGLSGGNGTISNCTIVGNMSNLGGGISCYYADPTITNCIVYGNTTEQIYTYTGEPVVTYCDVGGGWEGEGNIDADPLFVDAAGGDYHLQWDSPCINAGDPNFVPEEGEVDIDGEPRVMGGRVDMGADEVGEKQADFTRDGRIDIADLAVLSGSWDTAEDELNWYVLCDLWEDDVIDIGDLAAFVEDWMWRAEWAD